MLSGAQMQQQTSLFAFKAAISHYPKLQSPATADALLHGSTTEVQTMMYMFRD
jgi:hypothetical protein